MPEHLVIQIEALSKNLNRREVAELITRTLNEHGVILVNLMVEEAAP